MICRISPARWAGSFSAWMTVSSLTCRTGRSRITGRTGSPSPGSRPRRSSAKAARRSKVCACRWTGHRHRCAMYLRQRRPHHRHPADSRCNGQAEAAGVGTDDAALVRGTGELLADLRPIACGGLPTRSVSASAKAAQVSNCRLPHGTGCSPGCPEIRSLDHSPGRDSTQSASTFASASLTRGWRGMMVRPHVPTPPSRIFTGMRAAASGSPR
jgi:hypothetical protein